MGNFTFDVKKAKGTSDATQSDHIERKVIPHNADPTRTHLNMALVTYPDGVNGRDEAIAYRLKTAGIKRSAQEHLAQTLHPTAHTISDVQLNLHIYLYLYST